MVNSPSGHMLDSSPVMIFKIEDPYQSRLPFLPAVTPLDGLSWIILGRHVRYSYVLFMYHEECAFMYMWRVIYALF